MHHEKPFRSLTAVVIALLATTSETQAAPRLAFRTSATGTGDLSSWPQAQGQTGLAAGDVICRNLAEAANLPQPQTFVAWLSDTNTDAYCRLFDLTGKKANQCGQAVLPTGAGPWNRIDGVAFAETIEKMLGQGQVYSPLNVDEQGTTLGYSFDGYALTGTGIDGTYDGANWVGDCGGWTDANSFAPAGEMFSATGDWTFNGQPIFCGIESRLICLQTGAGTALAHGHRGHREAFLSSVTVTGNLGASPLAGGATGIAAGDAICRSLAQNAGLYRPQTFKALLADSTHHAFLPPRFTHDGPWYRLDGRLFANNLTELAANTVTLPLNLTETGQYIGEGLSHLQGTTIAWTGADFDGSYAAGETCQDWTSTGGSAAHSIEVNSVGIGEAGYSHWISAGDSRSCDVNYARLVCLSDADVIFHDEYETL